MNQRNKFIRFLFQSLQAYEYVLLKHIAKDLNALDDRSDLDILVSKRELKQVLPQLILHPDIDKYYLDKKSDGRKKVAVNYIYSDS